MGSGNVAVPIDKELPAEEVKWLIGKADVTGTLVSKTYADLVMDVEGLQVMTHRQLLAGGEGGTDDYELYHPQPEELACIFFTSGTSDRSKGVMLSHGNLASEIVETSKLFKPAGTSTLVVLPFHHSFGLIVAVMMGL